MKNILCGSKCVIWLLKETNLPYENINKHLYFVTDIANELIKNGFDIEIYCYNSNLYNDYKNCKLEIVQARESIAEINTKSRIIEKRFTKKELLKELQHSYILLNVDSRIINKTKENTGHFVILKNEPKGILLINPEKTKFTKKVYTPEEIINMCKNNGNWRIKIGEKI